MFSILAWIAATSGMQPPPAIDAERPLRLVSGGIFSTDYPAAATYMEAEGVTRMRILVGPDARIRACGIFESSGHTVLDRAACRIARERFVFAPAMRGGQAVQATYSQSVRWVLPEDMPRRIMTPPPPILFAEGMIETVAKASAQGVAECRVEQSGTAFSLYDVGDCDEIGATPVFFSEIAANEGSLRVRFRASVSPAIAGQSPVEAPAAPVFEETLDVDIAPNGQAIGCVRTASRGEKPEFASVLFEYSCDTVLVGSRFFAGEGVRRMRIRQAVFVERTGEGAAAPNP